MGLLDDLVGDPDPSAGQVFEYSLAELSQVGVEIAEEQRVLLEKVMGGWSPVTAMTVGFLTDPGDRYRMEEPMFAWNVDHDAPDLMAFPQVVSLDWDFVSTLESEENPDPTWRRFPSLPGRKRVIEMGGWGSELQGIEAYRIWHLWPLEDEFSQTLEEAVESWMEEDLFEIDEFNATDRGDYDLCEFATNHGGGEPKSHVHMGYDGEVLTDPGHYISGAYYCQTGEDMFQDCAKRLLVSLDAPGGEVRYLRHPGGPRLLPGLQTAWDSLIAVSKACSIRSIEVYPPWERDAMRLRERYYSPWLW